MNIESKGKSLSPSQTIEPAPLDEQYPSVDPAEPNKSSLSRFAVENPHFIIVACLLAMILGGMSLLLLPKDLLPSANLPAVQILSFYPGMSVERVDKNLTARFERYTGQAIGLERQESRSLSGVSVVRNFFGSSTDLNTAISQTTSLVMSVLRRLPPGTQPPLILPFDPMASTPLALVAVSGDKTEKDLYDSARYDVRNTIQSVTGAMAPTVMGGAERQIVVYLDPEKVKRRNFSPLNIAEKLTKLNTFIPSGNIKIGDRDLQILSNGIVDQVSEMNDFPMRSNNEVPVFLNELGEARDASKIQTNIVMIDGRRQVYVPVYRQPGSNSIQIIDDVKGALAKLESRLDGIKLKLVADQSSFIRKAIASITEEAMLGGGLAALLVFVFLGSFRATTAIMLSLPLSLLCAFMGLKAVGETINAMTLGGLALSIGVLVDNSIVVLENISRKLELGYSRTNAAIIGAQEVAMPVLASTLATLVVFFPVFFLQGITKVLFSSLAKAVCFAMLGSFLAAVCVIPLFSSRFLTPPQSSAEQKGILGWISRGIDALCSIYGRSLRFALTHKSILLGAVMFLLIAAGLLARGIGTELFPRADSGNFVINARLPSGTRIEKTEERAKAVEESIREWIPSSDLEMIIGNLGVYYGFPAAFTPNSGPQDFFLNIQLKEHRKNSSQHYARIVREKMKAVYPEVEVGIELGGLLTSALNGGLKSPIDIQIQGPKSHVSEKLAKELSDRIRAVSGIIDVRVQQRFDSPQIKLDVDRRKAGALGLTIDEVAKNVVSALNGSSVFNPAIWVDPSSGIDYLLGVQFPEAKFTSTADLLRIPITGHLQERSVPLSRVASVTEQLGPTELNHVNLQPVIDVYADAQGKDIGAVSREVQSVLNQIKMPAGYTGRIRGEVSQMNAAVASLGGSFFLAAILVYLILVVQFRSFLLPGIIMAVLPIGLSGIVITLALTKTYFSIQAAIGAIFMIGIAVANGVLLIEFILHKVEELENFDMAIVEAAKIRLRPILMTSLASMLGLLPMAIGLGHGSEANIPLGRAVIGGQFVSTILTLFVVPALFQLLAKKKKGTSSPNPDGNPAVVTA